MSDSVVDHDVAIIGAGAAGIGAARRLIERRLSVVLLEARERIGGRALTVPTDLGYPVDLGCEWLHSGDRNPWTVIACESGFTVDETLPDWGARLRRAGASAEDETAWHVARDAFYDRMEAAGDAEPDRAAATLLPPGSRWNPLLDAISTWANGVELDRLSLQDHARYADSGVNWRVHEGYGALIAAYGKGLPVRLGCPVQRVDLRGRAIAVETTRGSLRVRAALLTVPPTLLAGETIRFTPALPATKRAAAHGVPLGLANKLFLALDGTPPDLPQDGHLVGALDRLATGSYQMRPHGRPMVAAYFGGALALDLEHAGAAAMADFAVGELADLFGSAIRPRLRPLASSAWATDDFARGSYSYALPGHADDRAILAAPVDDRLFFAGEACSPANFSTAHGALLSGREAADRIADLLGRRTSSEPGGAAR
ncbi:MAG TPA: NAD(P)/FAD-dependent oxidoreductase [Stellaceae bacterium]|nr:NAD(P)/FAD-dependent oxidoreductase [Stellaceae bacterium]